MWQYLIRRVLQACLTLIVISIIIFGLISSVPGGILSAYSENPDYTQEDLARLREKYGLDDPVPVRYLKWLGNVLQGDWGNSFTSKRPALQEIGDRLPNTLLLMGTMFIVTLMIAIPLGVFSALRQYSALDHILTSVALAGQSLPTFWFGLLLIILFSVVLKTPTGEPLLPSAGMTTAGQPFSMGDLIKHMILPITMLALVSAASYMRYMRASMLEVIHKDYIRTARGKGLKEGTVIFRHAFRNALIPIVTLLGLDLPNLFGGALFTETIFAWPGIGRLFFDAAMKTDYPVLMAVLMVYSFLIIVSNLMVDVMYTVLDPRISLK